MTPMDRWRLGSPLVIVCWFRGHKPGSWFGTYQPHVEEQRCSRCGAMRLRTKPE